MLTPPPPPPPPLPSAVTQPAYRCEQLFYIDLLKQQVTAKANHYFRQFEDRPHIRLHIRIIDPTRRKLFLDKFELLIFRRTIFKFTKDGLFLDIYESEVPTLLNMTELSDVTVIGEPVLLW